MFEALLIIPVPLALNNVDDMLDVYEGATPPAMAFSFIGGPPEENVATEDAE